MQVCVNGSNCGAEVALQKDFWDQAVVSYTNPNYKKGVDNTANVEVFFTCTGTKDANSRYRVLLDSIAVVNN